MDVAAIYEEYHWQIFGYVYRYTYNVQVAEDLAQLVFVRLLEAVQKGQPWRGKLKAWLFEVAHNAMVDLFRRKESKYEMPLDAALSTELGVDAEMIYFRRWLPGAMARMTPAQRRVIELRFVEGMNTLEVAAELGTTFGAVSALQRRGCASMREEPGWHPW